MRRILGAAAALAVLVCLSASSSRAQDDPKTKLQKLQQEAQKKRDAAKQLGLQAKNVLQQLHKTEMSLGAARKQVQLYTDKEIRLARDITVVERDLSNTRSARTMTQTELARRLKSAYHFGKDHELEFLMSTRSFADLDLRLRWVGLIAGRDEHMVDRLGMQADSINLARTVLEQKKKEIEQVRQQKQVEQKKMEGLRADRKQALQKIQTQKQSYEAAAAELERSAKRIQAILAELERRQREEEKKRAGGAPIPESKVFVHGHGSLPWPVHGPVLEAYGEHRHPKFGTQTFNNGIDIQAAEGTEVHSVDAGEVVFVDWIDGYGQTVMIQHGSGFVTLYAHCSSVLVANGQHVAAGQAIAHVGDTGSLNGAELHFEVRKGRTAQDPMDWLR
jgi:septal ring factor EnvC (AmiA/AmiB activator)